MGVDLNIIEPLLDASEIQGNILGGFNKDHQALLPMYFESGADDISAVRRWLREVLEEISWLSEVATFRRKLKARVAFGAATHDLTALWTNISFSYPGLRKLTADAVQFEPVFRDGLPVASARIGDPLLTGTPGHVSSWIFGGPDKIPDILAVIAGDSVEAVEARVERFLVRAAQAGISCPHFDIGHELGHYPGVNSMPVGREHFGFRDGISQPGVRGRIDANPDFYVTDRTLAADPNGTATEPEYSAPGQPLVFPGEFVLGYARQSIAFAREPQSAWPLGDDSSGLGQSPVGPMWARNGSFLVYRRLRQDVPAFNRFLKEQRDRLAQFPEFVALTIEQLGAMLIGRWRSGAPLLRTPGADDTRLGSNNDFAFQSNSPATDGLPNAIDDPTGEVSPSAAHIRKVNPRDLATDQGGPNASLTKRLLRRGIPYGPPLSIGATSDPENADRGLLFMSYQTSIRDQFEFLLTTWANDPSKPTPQLSPNSGFDMVIGQNPEAGKQRFCLLGSANRRVETARGRTGTWVVPTGGGYFFTPSRSAISGVLAAQND